VNLILFATFFLVDLLLKPFLLLANFPFDDFLLQMFLVVHLFLFMHVHLVLVAEMCEMLMPQAFPRSFVMMEFSNNGVSQRWSFVVLEPYSRSKGPNSWAFITLVFELVGYHHG
jgi:hypothetical protein